MTLSFYNNLKFCRECDQVFDDFENLDSHFMQIHAAMKKETTTENSKAKLRKKCMDFAIKMVFDYAYGLLNLREYECNHFSFLTEQNPNLKVGEEQLEFIFSC